MNLQVELSEKLNIPTKHEESRVESSVKPHTALPETPAKPLKNQRKPLGNPMEPLLDLTFQV